MDIVELLIKFQVNPRKELIIQVISTYIQVDYEYFNYENFHDFLAILIQNSFEKDIFLYT